MSLCRVPSLPAESDGAVSLMGEDDPALDDVAMWMSSVKFAGSKGGVHGAAVEGESELDVVADPTDRSEGVDCFVRPLAE